MLVSRGETLYLTSTPEEGSGVCLYIELSSGMWLTSMVEMRSMYLFGLSLRRRSRVQIIMSAPAPVHAKYRNPGERNNLMYKWTPDPSPSASVAVG